MEMFRVYYFIDDGTILLLLMVVAVVVTMECVCYLSVVMMMMTTRYRYNDWFVLIKNKNHFHQTDLCEWIQVVMMMMMMWIELNTYTDVWFTYTFSMTIFDDDDLFWCWFLLRKRRKKKWFIQVGGLATIINYTYVVEWRWRS